MDTSPNLSLEILPSIALKTFIFVHCLGVTTLLAYGLAFLYSFGPPPSSNVTITAIITAYFYLMCSFAVYGFSDLSFDFYHVFIGALALYLTLIFVSLAACASLAALWLLIREEVIGTMWTLTDAMREQYRALNSVALIKPIDENGNEESDDEAKALIDQEWYER